jgi:hypothetical protein
MKNNSGNREEKNKEAQMPGMNTGNASNPSPQDNSFDQVNSHQLLNKKAEKYIREAGNIEDLPDPQEQQDAKRDLDIENE